MSKEYVTQADAAKELGQHRQRVWTLINDGEIQTETVAGIRMITRRELDRFKAKLKADGRKK